MAASPWELSHGSGTPDNGSKYEVFSRPLEEHSVTLAFEDPLNSGPKDWIDTQTDDIKWLQRMVGGLRDSCTDVFWRPSCPSKGRSQPTLMPWAARDGFVDKSGLVFVL